jgi:cell division protein FtsW (lipid II flippase)
MISSVSVYSSFRITSLLQSSGDLDAANNHFYVFRNIIHVTIGLTLLLFLVKIPYKFWEKNSKYFL